MSDKKDKKSNDSGIGNVDRRRLLGYLGTAGIGVPFLASCNGQSDAGTTAVNEAPSGPGMGYVVEKGANNYESWRGQLAWHSFVSDRRPQTIVRPENREQVVEAVNYARENGLKISVKSGGHNYYESWMRDDCLLLDLYNFRHVEVEEETQSAWVEPSVWGYSLLKALQPYDLAFPISTCLSVGMGGYIMGGGIGYGWQDWGMACHNVLAVDVVTADGEIVTATPEQHEDLFWAARGGVAGFPGVVLRWKLQCHKDPAKLRVTGKIFPMSKMADVIDAGQAVADKEIPGVHIHVVLLPTAMALAMFLTPEAAAQTQVEDQYVCLTEFYVLADSDEATQAVTDETMSAPIFAEDVATSVHTGSGLIAIYEELKGREITYVNQVCSAVFTDKVKESMESIVEPLTNSNADVSYVAVLLNGRNMHQDDAAFSVGRKGSGSMSCYGLWFTDNEQDAADWAAGISAALDPLSEGRYINETDCFRHPEQVQRAYTPENWEKLHVVNKKYDPDALFHTFPGFEEA